MAYELGALEALKSMPAGIWFLFALPLVFAEIAAWQTGNSRRYLVICLSTMIIPIAIACCSFRDILGDGWRLEGNRLEFKAWETHETIDLKSA